MQEEFLHYLWKFRLFNSSNLFTSAGEQITILKTGTHNSDSGPDFFNAKIKIGKTTWAGNVEIHVKSSEWKKHKHHLDSAYRNVILHVVYDEDAVVKRSGNDAIPTLVVKDKIPKESLSKYQSFQSSKDWIPCANQISGIDNLSLKSWLDRLAIERLERKSEPILTQIKQTKNNWEEILYQTLARSVGHKVNAEPFEILARKIPYLIIKKYVRNVFQIEALLLGSAGLLEGKFKDSHPRQLQKEYKFLKQKHKLKSMDASLWKFMRLYPANFPTIRISQFADLLSKSPHLFSKITTAKNYKSISTVLECNSSSYWETHYRFDKKSPKRIKNMGKDTLNTILINAVVPVLFNYGKQKGDESCCDVALEILESLNAETNNIISKWEKLGVKAKNSFESQALLELKNEYCTKKKCLECAIGTKLLQPNQKVV